MSWFTFSWSRKPNARPVRPARRHARLEIEPLEERITLNNRFVVPAGTPVDNQTNFANLQTALSTTGLNNGDVIQIEPGSSPGNISNLTLPTQTNITIQGDPLAGLSATPQFTISDTSFNALPSGWTFRGLNIGLTGTAALVLDSANDAITSCEIVDLSSTSDFIVKITGASDALSNSTLTNQVSVHSLVEVDASAGSTNLVSGDSFVANATVTQHILLETATSAVSTKDSLVGNSFLAMTGTTTGIALIQVDPNVSSGFSVQGNIISDPDSGTTGIKLGGGAQSVSVSANQILLPSGSGTQPVAIRVDASSTGTTTATVSGNILSAAIGLQFATAAGTLDASVSGNDFHNDTIGVDITGTGSAAGIDLGGGSQSSLGGNNFRTFTVTGSASAGAIVALSGTSGTILAQHNIFSVTTPHTVCFAGGATFDTSIDSTALTGNAAYVESLYIDFLHRAGNTTSASDAGVWVTALNSSAMSLQQVANGIIRSQESLADQVDALYLKILGRPADSAGQSAFVSNLQNGGTLEQVEAAMFGSAEYDGDVGSNGAFIQSLYNKLLGRVGSASEVQGWLNVLPSAGAAAVAADFLASAEFRADAVRQMYGNPLAQLASTPSTLPNLLHRTAPASTAEVNGWVNSGLDLLSLEVAIASTGEFYLKG